jgi:hypothetical protein
MYYHDYSRAFVPDRQAHTAKVTFCVDHDIEIWRASLDGCKPGSCELGACYR